MTASGVLTPTGHPPLDILLQHLISLFELVFPDRIRAYYLIGSSIDGTAVYIPGDPLNSSDIDLVVVFKDDLHSHELERFIDCRQACAGLSQLHVDQLDATPVSERYLVQHGHLTLKVASRHLYGEDIHHRIPLPSLQDHIDAAIRLSKDHMAELRHLAPVDLMPPLTYPDPTGEFYGYDYSEVGYSDQPGTRILVGHLRMSVPISEIMVSTSDELKPVTFVKSIPTTRFRCARAVKFGLCLRLAFGCTQRVPGLQWRAIIDSLKPWLHH